MKKALIIIFMILLCVLNSCIPGENGNKVNPNDNITTETYEEGKLFYDGLAVVGNKYINKQYEVAIDDNFYECEPFYKNKAIVSKDYLEYYVINNEGAYLLGPYDRIYLSKQLDVYICYKEGMASIYNLDLKKVLNHDVEYVSFIGTNDANVDLEGVLYVRHNGLYGAIDKYGNWIIEPKYKEEFIFNDGLADVTTVDNRALVIDKKDNVIMELNKTSQTDTIVSLSNYVFIRITNYEKVFINQFEKEFIDEKYSMPIYYSDNFIHVWCNKTNGQNTFINKDGTQVIDKIFDNVSEIDKFLICSQKYERYIYDFNGNLVINRPFHSIEVNKNHKYIKCTNYNNLNDYEVVEDLFYDYDGNLIYENTDLNPFVNKNLFKCSYTNKYYLNCSYYDNGYQYYVEEIVDKKAQKLEVEPTTLVYNGLFIYKDYISYRYIIRDINNNIIYNIETGGNVDFYSDGYIMFRESIVLDASGKIVFE